MDPGGAAARRMRAAEDLLAAALPRARRDPRFPAWLQQALARDRRFGARDRRFHRELVYAAVRHLPWVERAPTGERARLALWLAADNAETAPARATLLAGWPPLPSGPDARAEALRGRLGPGAGKAGELFPGWLARERPAALVPAEAALLLTRPPLWLRVQRGEPEEAIRRLAAEGISATPGPIAGSLRVTGEPDVTRTAAHEEGLVEVQDAGSQWILAAVAPAPGERWLDACAGAGGKTLQLAAAVGRETPVVAHDVRPAALAELRHRAARAGLTGIRTTSRPEGLFDAVLVDAPCSGSGTWRRHPHLKWQTPAGTLEAAARRQLALLRRFAAHVRPGGRLVYATCSLARTEDEDVIARFLAGAPEFAPEPAPRPQGVPWSDAGGTLPASRFDSDWFYLACLRRRG